MYTVNANTVFWQCTLLWACFTIPTLVFTTCFNMGKMHVFHCSAVIIAYCNENMGNIRLTAENYTTISQQFVHPNGGGQVIR